jgi:hypothetical protein
MQAKNVISLRNIIKRKSAEFGLRQLAYSPQVIYLAAPQELFHLMTELTSPVAPSLPLQLSIQCEKDAVRALLFPSPRILTEQTAGHFLGLVNEANQELYRGSALGRFWVDVKNLDLAYEFIFKEAMLESDPEEIATQLFDVSLAHFYDLHIPLVMQAGGIWDCNTALLYLQQLRKDGYVDNKDFGLW